MQQNVIQKITFPASPPIKSLYFSCSSIIGNCRNIPQNPTPVTTVNIEDIAYSCKAAEIVNTVIRDKVLEYFLLLIGK